MLGSLLALVGATLSPVGAEVLLDVPERATLPGVVDRIVLCHPSPTRGNRRARDHLDRGHLSLLHRRGLGAVNLAKNGEHVRLGLGPDPAATLSGHHPPSTSWVVSGHNERSRLAHVFVLRLRFGGRLNPLDKTLDLRDQLLLELMNAAVSRAHLPVGAGVPEATRNAPGVDAIAVHRQAIGDGRRVLHIHGRDAEPQAEPSVGLGHHFELSIGPRWDVRPAPRGERRPMVGGLPADRPGVTLEVTGSPVAKILPLAKLAVAAQAEVAVGPARARKVALRTDERANHRVVVDEARHQGRLALAAELAIVRPGDDNSHQSRSPYSQPKPSDSGSSSSSTLSR